MSRSASNRMQRSGLPGDPSGRRLAAASAALRKSPLFSGAPDGAVEELLETGDLLSLSSGEILLEEGTPGDRFYVILTGEVEVVRTEGGRAMVLDCQGPGGFLSEMSLLEGRPRSASARAVRDTEVLSLSPEVFWDVLERLPGVASAMLKIVLARLRSTESSTIERARMVGLGTLAAGLAHELNNPAAALARNTDLLPEAMAEWRRAEADLAHLPLSRLESAVVDRLRGEGTHRDAPPHPGFAGSGMREMEVGEWLQSHGVRESWKLTPVLAEGGWDPERLDTLARDLDPRNLEPVLGWLAANLEAAELTAGIRTASGAISDLVARVRSYSFLDRGPVQKVDVVQSITDTLSILKGLLGPGVEVRLDLPSDLPRIEAQGGELGQVWTNLIQNAVDAMKGEGTLGIQAREWDGGVVVGISDTGPGIPEAIRPRIFDPFFTTSADGRGTGLGLAITWGIVVNQHRGAIHVDSRPGRTLMEVTLPRTLPGNRG